MSSLQPMSARSLEWRAYIKARPWTTPGLQPRSGARFIEYLVDVNRVLKDFKLRNPKLPARKVEQDVREAGLENIRLASCLLSGEREDPDIEKKIVVMGNGTNPNIVGENS